MRLTRSFFQAQFIFWTIASISQYVFANPSNSVQTALSAADSTESINYILKSQSSSIVSDDTLEKKSYQCKTNSASDQTHRRFNIFEPLPAMPDMITNLPNDWWRWTKTTFTTENIPAFFGMGVLTTGLVATDYETWQPFKKAYDNSGVFKSISDIGAFIGDGTAQFSLAAGFAAYGFALHDTIALRTASQTVEAILATGTVVQIIKHITGRESPFVSSTPTGRWRLFPNQIEYHKHVAVHDAFPSGHIATAFAVFLVIRENYPNQKWIDHVGYSLVGMVGIGLVATSIHWWSDIPLGLLLGYSFAMLISHRSTYANDITKTEQTYMPGISVTMLQPEVPAINLHWQW